MDTIIKTIRKVAHVGTMLPFSSQNGILVTPVKDGHFLIDELEVFSHAKHEPIDLLKKNSTHRISDQFTLV